jgi:hypothetical protein
VDGASLNDSVTLAINVPARGAAVFGGDGDDTIDASGTVSAIKQPLQLDGGTGANVVIGSGGSDDINASSGTDIVQAGAGDDRISSDSGDATNTAASIACGEGVDRVRLGPGDSLKIDCEKLSRFVAEGGTVRCGCTAEILARGKRLGVKRKKKAPFTYAPIVPMNTAKAATVIGSAASVPAKFKTRFSERVRGKLVKKSRTLRFFLTP